MIDVDLTRFFESKANGGKGTWACSLEPIRQAGPHALNLHDIPALLRVSLCETLTAWSDVNHSRMLVHANDVFKLPRDRFAPVTLIPTTGKLARATFHFYFSDSTKPRSVTITPPGTLQVERMSDTEIVIQWALAHGFISAQPPDRSVPDEQSMAIP